LLLLFQLFEFISSTRARQTIAINYRSIWRCIYDNWQICDSNVRRVSAAGNR